MLALSCIYQHGCRRTEYYTHVHFHCLWPDVIGVAACREAQLETVCQKHLGASLSLVLSAHNGPAPRQTSRSSPVQHVAQVDNEVARLGGHVHPAVLVIQNLQPWLVVRGQNSQNAVVAVRSCSKESLHCEIASGLEQR